MLSSFREAGLGRSLAQHLQAMGPAGLGPEHLRIRLQLGPRRSARRAEPSRPGSKGSANAIWKTSPPRWIQQAKTSKHGGL